MTKHSIVSPTAAAQLSRSWSGEIAATLLLALPIALTQLAAIALAVTDTIMLGWLGPDELAAGALSFRLFVTCYIFALGLVSAVGPIIAQEVGRGDDRSVRRSFRQGFWVAVTISVPMMVLIWFSGTILLLFGQVLEVAAAAQVYSRGVVWCFPAIIGMGVLRHFLAAHQRPRLALVASVIGIALNGLLNWLVLSDQFGFSEHGYVGIGVGTAISYWVMFLGLLFYTLRMPEFRQRRLLQQFWVADWERYREIFALGLPIAFTILSESILFVAMVLIVGAVQPDALAGHVIVNQLASIAFMIPLGISHAVTVRVGLAKGAGRPDCMRRTAIVSVVLSLVLAVFPAVTLWAVPETVLTFYLPSSSGDTIAARQAALYLMGFGILLIMIDGPQVVAHGVLRGLKDTRVPLLISMGLNFLIMVPAGYGLAAWFDWGAVGAWVATILGLGLAGLLLIWRCWRRLRVEDQLVFQ